jgi:hypothetical protein
MEPPSIDPSGRMPRLQGIYLAQGHGCVGIVEGLRHFGFGHLLD